jgi:hypothetical protein
LRGTKQSLARNARIFVSIGAKRNTIFVNERAVKKGLSNENRQIWRHTTPNLATRPSNMRLLASKMASYNPKFGVKNLINGVNNAKFDGFVPQSL